MTQVEKVPKQSNSWLVIFVLLISVTALCFSAYIYLCIKNTNYQFKILENNILKTITNDLSNNQQALDSQIIDLKNQIKHINNQQINSNLDLFQAKFILQIAEIYSHNITNFSNTIDIYTKVLNLLNNNPEVIELHGQIQSFLQNLTTAEKSNCADIFKKIDEAQNMVSQVIIKLPHYETKIVNNNMNFLQKNLQKLRSMIIIKHHTQASNPIYSLRELKLIQSTLQLKLQIAQLSLIENNFTLYSESLNQALLILQSNNLTPNKKLVNLIMELKNTTIFQDTTKLQQSIRNSIQQLNTYIDSTGNKKL